MDFFKIQFEFDKTLMSHQRLKIECVVFVLKIVFGQSNQKVFISMLLI